MDGKRTGGATEGITPTKSWSLYIAALGSHSSYSVICLLWWFLETHGDGSMHIMSVE
jgi:hypothetical protein